MKILFVDDNLSGMKFHVMELRRYSEVNLTPVDNVDRALITFQEEKDSWNGVILDLQMPKGDLVPITEDPQTSGRHLLDAIRRLRASVPAIVLTNVETHPVLRDLASFPHTKVVPKKRYLAEEFAKVALDFFRAANTTAVRHS